MEDKSLFSSSQPQGGISEDFRQFIKETIEEVLIEGKTFDVQKRWLRRLGATEGVDCDTLERNMTDLIEVMEEWKQLKAKSGERMAKMISKECYLTEQEIEGLLQKLAGGNQTATSVANPTKDASMMSGSQSHAAEDEYISECIKEVCINGDSLSKYQRLIEKKHGAEFYQQCEGFVEEVQRSVGKKKFTNTSVANLHYLARQIGVSEGIVDAVVEHYTGRFEEEQQMSSRQSLLGILVLDGSGSMEELTAQKISKADAVSKAVNDLFSKFKERKCNYSFAIVNYDHRSIVKMKPTPVKDIVDHGDYNPMDGLGGATNISLGLKDAKKMSEDFLSRNPNGIVVVMLMTDGIDMTQHETVSLANAMKQMKNVKLTGCFFETMGADAAAMKKCADFIQSLCSSPDDFRMVNDYWPLREFFFNSIDQDQVC